MMNTLENTLQQLTDERSNHISTYLKSHHDQFKTLSHKCTDYFNILKTTLPEDAHDLLFQYEDLMNYLRSISQDFIYKQGLKDGAQLLKLLSCKQSGDLP